MNPIEAIYQIDFPLWFNADILPGPGSQEGLELAELARAVLFGEGIIALQLGEFHTNDHFVSPAEDEDIEGGLSWSSSVMPRVVDGDQVF